ncbi:perilipin-1 [Antechinus flavipes]|uniref:perilipin-1 n=1 Tax=Antechinus flavipes TaxID=38775 RepID=UPI002236240A|nr:perilipin-1 [Antechinus flavipes]
MAVDRSRTTMDGNHPEQENVLQRVFQLPVVSGTCECFQKTYTSTKEAHPLVASVCNAYEKGVQGASNLAAWSMEPVVRRLSTQFTAANELACRGLDHLEEKIPALQYPPEKIASELKDTISTRIRSARNSFSVPIASTSDKVLGAALAGCELAWGMARDTADYASSTRVGQLAAGGADLALSNVEKVVNYLMPAPKENPAPVLERPSPPQVQQKLLKPKPSFLQRIGTLTNNISQHTFQTTIQTLRWGHALAKWIPGVAPLSSMAQWGVSAALEVVSRPRSTSRGNWQYNQAQEEEEDEEEDEEEEEEEDEENLEMRKEENKLNETRPSNQSLLGSVVHTLQSAYLTTVSTVKWAPFAIWNNTAGRLLHLTSGQETFAKGRAMSLSDALKGVTDNVVDTVVHYVPLPRLSLMEPESEFQDIDNPPSDTDRSEGASSPTPEVPSKLLHRSSLRSTRNCNALSFLGLEDKLFTQQKVLDQVPQQRSSLHRGPTFEPDTPASSRSMFSSYHREKPTRRVSDSFYRPSVMEPIYNRIHHSQLYKKN